MTRTVPGHVDSTGKLLERLALVAKNPVTQKGKVIRTPPDRLLVSPSVMRRFDCIAGCTACCLPFTLDFTPDEYDNFPMADDVEKMAMDKFYVRTIEVNGHPNQVATYDQFRDDSCPFLRETRVMADGTPALGCGFWTEDNSTQPLECAAAPQVLMTTRGEGTTMIMKRPFGRGWAWKNKPQCHFDPVLDKVSKIPDDYDLSNEIMLMERYLHWAEHLSIDTYLPEIIEVLKDFPARLRDSGLASVVVVER